MPPRPSGLVSPSAASPRAPLRRSARRPACPGCASRRPSTSVSRTSRRARSEHGDLRGERVVVAEGDLVGGGRVVLVHDRHRAELEQRGQRAAGVDVRRAVADVRSREQYLGRGPSGASASSHAAWSRAWPSAEAAWSRATFRGRRSRPSRGSPSAIAPDETTQTGSPPSTIVRISRRARAAASAATVPPGPATRLDPSLTTTASPALRPVADDAVLAQPEVAVRDRAARAGNAVDVDPGLGRAGQLEAVGEPRRRVPEAGGAAVAVEEALGRVARPR